MTARLLATLASAALLAGMPAIGNAKPMEDTPAPAAANADLFETPSTLPFHAPDFAHIQDSDYQPAIERGIQQKLAEIQAIADNPEPPTFENTLVAMERSGQELNRAYNPFGQLVAANTNDVLNAADAAISPKLAAMRDAIYLNDRLFARVKAVYDNRAAMSMTPEDAMLLETTYADFVHAGALLSAKDKESLKTMNGKIAELQTEFSQKLTKATAAKAPIFDSKEELAGLPEAQIAAAAKLAAEMGQPGKYAIALINTTQQPALSMLTNRESRKKLYEASVNRSSAGDEFDTTAIVKQLAALRARKAALLGEANFASYVMYDRMLKDPAAATKFMKDFVPALSATQLRESQELQEMAAADGKNFQLEPWDWEFYAEKLRQARYDYDEAAVKPYFQVWRTLEDGVFYAANKAYGITAKQRTDIPTYHPDMRVYTIYDKDGSELGLFYIDPFARPNKQGGAWMGNFVEQSDLLGDKPVIYNTLNIAPPNPGEPALMTFDDVTTMFHEFGHALHGLFAHQKYPSLSGTNTARDFVEFPSQFNENFATVPDVIANYAKHQETGEAIPADLLAKIEAARTFNQGLAFGEIIEAALLDLNWHEFSADQAEQDPAAFERKAMAATGLMTDMVPPRYRTPYFRHIWEGGYAGGYYSYVWTEALAHDAWDWVETHGGPTRENGEHIRDTFLGEGHTKDYAQMYRNFAGRDPQVQAMVKARGLDQADVSAGTQPSE